MFNLMSINKFQRSRMTFVLSAKDAHIENIVFAETTWPIEIKFHMTTPYDWLAKIYTNCYDWLAKIYTNCYCHMTKMATVPIYGKNSLNIFFS